MNRRRFMLAAASALAGAAVASRPTPAAEESVVYEESRVSLASLSFTILESHMDENGVLVIDRAHLTGSSRTPVSRRRYRTRRTAAGLETELIEEVRFV
jgi:hypothetical protein